MWKLLTVVLVVVIGICDAREQEYLYVFPNPAKEPEVKFHFNYRDIVDRIEISIYDLSCREIITRSFTPAQTFGALNLHIGDLKGGLYIWHAEVLLKAGIKKEYVKLLGVIR